MIRGWDLGAVAGDLAILGGFVVFFAFVASRMIKRQVA